MSEFDGSNGDRTGQREPPDPMMYAGMPPGGYEPHPLFPRDDDAPEDPSEAVLIAMITAQGEMARVALTAALSHRPTEGSGTAVELLKVMREWAPQGQPQAQASMSERLSPRHAARTGMPIATLVAPRSES